MITTQGKYLTLTFASADTLFQYCLDVSEWSQETRIAYVRKALFMPSTGPGAIFVMEVKNRRDESFECVRCHAQRHLVMLEFFDPDSSFELATITRIKECVGIDMITV
jgi:hypothetical protein